MRAGLVGLDAWPRGLSLPEHVDAALDAAAESRVAGLDARVEERDRDAAPVEAGQGDSRIVFAGAWKSARLSVWDATDAG